MAVFAVMDATFGLDGLESKWAAFTADTLNEVEAWMIEQINDTPNRMELDLIIPRFVERLRDPADNYSGERETVPYPRTRVFETPDAWIAITAREQHFRALGDIGKTWVTHAAA